LAQEASAARDLAAKGLEAEARAKAVAKAKARAKGRVDVDIRVVGQMAWWVRVRDIVMAERVVRLLVLAERVVVL
jgi:hypothetical protein